MATTVSAMTTSPDVSGPVELPVSGSEVDTLLGALDRNRRTFAWKTGGLDADSMRRTLGPSTMTLGGLALAVGILVDDSVEQTRALMAELLGREASSQAALEAVENASKRRWWNSALLRDAATIAAEAIAAKLGQKASTTSGAG